MAHGDAREGKWRGNWRMEWVASTLTPPTDMMYPALLKLMRTTGLPAFDRTDAPYRFKWTRPFRGKTKSGFCACAITFHASYTCLRPLCLYFPETPLIFLQLFKETSHCRENPNANIPTNSVHLYTADHPYKQKNTNLIWKRDVSALYPYIPKQVHVCKPKYETLPSRLNIKQPLPDDQFILSSFRLPSPIWTTDPSRLDCILRARVVWIIDYKNVCGMK